MAPIEIRPYRPSDEDHYVHVHADDAEADRAARPLVGFGVGRTFVHADLADEGRLREQFKRVYVCRRFVRPADLRVPVP
ncbi:hypothetical protein [Nocardiopsis ganjiahuensis]|uniref:hypothetical protein n=1 Tax=Nocardiopsis ganjiahuensis TaxID=239984 RepID=UPI00034D40F3|nr:hypothetical protein [Nocardiopsis ganjiahuensis]